jgi:small-conductance mechanosensitive channel
MSPVTNYSKHYAQAIVTFSVPYETDIKNLTSSFNTSLKVFKDNHTEIISDALVLGVTQFLASGIEMTLTCQTQPNLQFSIERDLRAFILNELKALNIEIPLNHIVVSSKEKL